MPRKPAVEVTRSENIYARVTPTELQVIREAAAREERPVGSFLRLAARDRAQRRLSEAEQVNAFAP